MGMRVFVGCEYSGTVRNAFRRAGHEAWSCDILPTQNEGNHYQGDIFKALDELGHFDLAIFHPPCTYLCNSGVSHLHKDKSRWAKLAQAGDFFKRILDLPIRNICVENPIPHKYAVQRIGRKYDQLIQPWQFGHPESKATCLWLKGLNPLTPTNILQKPECGYWRNQTPSGQNKLGPSKDRWKIRSTTYEGIAKAMAAQWG